MVFAEHDPVGRAAQPPQAQATPAQAEQVPPGAQAQPEVDESSRRKLQPELAERAQRPGAGRRHAEPGGDRVDDLPLLPGFAARWDNRFGPLDERRRAEREEGRRDVLALEERGGGKDVSACRLVSVT